MSLDEEENVGPGRRPGHDGVAQPRTAAQCEAAYFINLAFMAVFVFVIAA